MGGPPPPPPTPDYSAPWNSPGNLAYGKAEFMATSLGQLETATHVFGVFGSDTAFDPNAELKYDELPHSLIIIIEVADSKTHWMQPGDYNVAELLAYTGRIGDHLHGLLPDRLHVLFADGQVWALSPDAPMSALHPFLTITGAKAHNRDQLLAPHRVDAPE